jgi:hypothetical protein
MDAATALMVLLSCSPGGAHCREVQGAHAYESAAACREALPSVLQSMKNTGRYVIGRCTLADTTPGLDHTTTASTTPGGIAEEGYAFVRVTRMKDGLPETTSYKVAKTR